MKDYEQVLAWEVALENRFLQMKKYYFLLLRSQLDSCCSKHARDKDLPMDDRYNYMIQ